MKKLSIFLLAAFSLVASCQKFDDTPIWDKLNDHEDRISTLEALCRQMNTNITSLQSLVEALQKNDCVTAVVPVTEAGVEIGYTITFASGKNITIYHGKDGSDGKDSYIPAIGVKQDADGIYYWTVDGSWLLDENGQKVKAVGTDGQNGTNGSNGQDGAPGAPGTPGTDGQNGVTPQLKIENGMWYVSYDNCASWTELGQATGPQGPQGDTGATGPQGPQGNPGVSGNSFFQSVTETSDYVLMVLANGTEIRIPKASAVAATLTLDNISGFTATFTGQVIRHSLDLKVTVYYSTMSNLTVYKNSGSVSVTEFNDEAFTMKLINLKEKTKYYYFTEIVCDGKTTFSEVMSFETGEADSYVDWEEGEKVEDEI